MTNLLDERTYPQQSMDSMGTDCRVLYPTSVHRTRLGRKTDIAKNLSGGNDEYY
jgi:hypothetical protein